MKKNAFTLIEVLLAIMLVGLAVASIVGATGALTKANSAGINLSTAEFLIEQIKELTVPVAVIDPETAAATFGPEEGSLASYDDLDDFDGASFCPPVDVGRQSMNMFSSWTQQVTVQNVSAGNFEQVVSDHTSNFVKITVNVLLNSEQVSTASWIRARY